MSTETAILAHRHNSGTLHGIACLLLALASFAVMDVLIKWLSTRYGTMQIVFFRSVFALLPVAALVAHRGGPATLKTRRPGGHMIRSTIGVSAMVCFVFALRHLPMADVYAINYTAPLLVTALSGPLLGERIGWRHWAAVAVGFLGVLIILRPGSGVFSSAAAVCLLGTTLYSFTLITIRKLSATEASAAIVFYFTLTTTTAGAVLMTTEWVTPRSPADTAMLVGIGLLGGTAQILMTEAFSRAPASVLAPFEYSSMIWAVLLGFLAFGDIPSFPVIAGTLIIVSSGLYILHRETRRID